MLPVKPERAVKVKHQQPKTSNKRFVRNAAEQLLHGRSIAHNASLDALRQPRAARDTAPPPVAVDAILAGDVSRFVVVRWFHPPNEKSRDNARPYNKVYFV